MTLHPSHFLKQAFIDAGVTPYQAAQAMGISHPTMYNPLRGGAITTKLALRLGKLLGTTPEYWLDLQRAWDLEQARVQIGHELEKIDAIA
jgi:addiction module HigA family antidote